MAFFHHNMYNGGADASSSFTPLLRLLDDFGSQSRRHDSGWRNAAGMPTWQPKFDVRETAEAYELHGELPGMVKENVHIEFNDPQAMLVTGRIERTYTVGTSPHDHLADTTTSGAIEEAGEEEKKERRNSRQPTIEDEDEANAPKQEVATTAEAPVQQQQQQQQQQPVDRAKYWLTERHVGEFSRNFSFPARIDQAGVTASLKDGILSITVPKAKKHESRRITIN
jgi:HSP20 family molecular chaperone IbpA